MAIEYTNIDEVLFKLSHFDPSYKDSKNCNLLDYIILNTLFNKYNEYIDVHYLRKDIFENFKIEYDEIEINESLKKLKNNGDIFKNGTNKKHSKLEVAISETKYKEIHNKVEEMNRLELAVFDKWISDLKITYINDIKIIEEKCDYLDDEIKEEYDFSNAKYGSS